MDIAYVPIPLSQDRENRWLIIHRYIYYALTPLGIVLLFRGSLDAATLHKNGVDILHPSGLFVAATILATMGCFSLSLACVGIIGSLRKRPFMLRVGSICLLAPAIGFVVAIVVSTGTHHPNSGFMRFSEPMFAIVSVVCALLCFFQTALGFFLSYRVKKLPSPYVAMNDMAS